MATRSHNFLSVGPVIRPQISSPLFSDRARAQNSPLRKDVCAPCERTLANIWLYEYGGEKIAGSRSLVFSDIFLMNIIPEIFKCLGRFPKSFVSSGENSDCHWWCNSLWSYVFMRLSVRPKPWVKRREIQTRLFHTHISHHDSKFLDGQSGPLRTTYDDFLLVFSKSANNPMTLRTTARTTSMMMSKAKLLCK